MPVRSAILAQTEMFSKESGMPWLTICLVALSAVVLLLVLRATRQAMRRCVFCGGVSVPLSAINFLKAEDILGALSDWEGAEIRPRNVMACQDCMTVYDCTPRGYAIVGATRLEKEEAIKAGVRLQVGDFGCHRCGDLLVETDSQSLSGADREIVRAATSRAGCSELRMRLFCRVCKTVHLWLPLADTGYKFLRAENMRGE